MKNWINIAGVECPRLTTFQILFSFCATRRWMVPVAFVYSNKNYLDLLLSNYMLQVPEKQRTSCSSPRYPQTGWELHLHVSCEDHLWNSPSLVLWLKLFSMSLWFPHSRDRLLVRMSRCWFVISLRKCVGEVPSSAGFPPNCEASLVSLGWNHRFNASPLILIFPSDSFPW